MVATHLLYSKKEQILGDTEESGEAIFISASECRAAWSGTSLPQGCSTTTPSPLRPSLTHTDPGTSAPQPGVQILTCYTCRQEL